MRRFQTSAAVLSLAGAAVSATLAIWLQSMEWGYQACILMFVAIIALCMDFDL